MGPLGQELVLERTLFRVPPLSRQSGPFPAGGSVRELRILRRRRTREAWFSVFLSLSFSWVLLFWLLHGTV